MELLILFVVILSASLIESIFSIALQPRGGEQMEDIDEHMESRFAQLKEDLGAPEPEIG